MKESERNRLLLDYEIVREFLPHLQAPLSRESLLQAIGNARQKRLPPEFLRLFHDSAERLWNQGDVILALLTGYLRQDPLAVKALQEDESEAPPVREPIPFPGTMSSEPGFPSPWEMNLPVRRSRIAMYRETRGAMLLALLALAVMAWLWYTHSIPWWERASVLPQIPLESPDR